MQLILDCVLGALNNTIKALRLYIKSKCYFVLLSWNIELEDLELPNTKKMKTTKSQTVANGLNAAEQKMEAKILNCAKTEVICTMDETTVTQSYCNWCRNTYGDCALI